MKKKLEDHFGNDLFIADINGKPNVATFRNKAVEILHEFYQSPKEIILRQSE